MNNHNSPQGIPRIGSGDLLGVAACILASCFGICLIIFTVGIGELDIVNSFGSLATGTNINRAENSDDNHTNAADGEKQSGRRVEKLPANGLRVDADAGCSSDSTNEQIVAEINAACTGSNTNRLKNVAPTNRLIRIDVIIHVVRD